MKRLKCFWVILIDLLLPFDGGGGNDQIFDKFNIYKIYIFSDLYGRR